MKTNFTIQEALELIRKYYGGEDLSEMWKGLDNNKALEAITECIIKKKIFLPVNEISMSRVPESFVIYFGPDDILSFEGFFGHEKDNTVDLISHYWSHESLLFDTPQNVEYLIKEIMQNDDLDPNDEEGIEAMNNVISLLTEVYEFFGGDVTEMQLTD